MQSTCRGKMHTTEITAIIFRDRGICIKNFCKFARNKKKKSTTSLAFSKYASFEDKQKQKLIKTVGFTDYYIGFSQCQCFSDTGKEVDGRVGHCWYFPGPYKREGKGRGVRALCKRINVPFRGISSRMSLQAHIALHVTSEAG